MMNNDDPKLVAERDARLAALGPQPPWWRPFARRRWKRERGYILATDVSQVTAMMRTLYTPECVEAIANRPHPSFAGITKEDAKVVAFTYSQRIRIVKDEE